MPWRFLFLDSLPCQHYNEKSVNRKGYLVLKVILIELIILAAVFVLFRLLRSRIVFFRGGYTLRKDSYMQDEKMKILVEDTHFRRGAERNSRSLRVDGTNLIYSRVPLDKENKALMVYSYCAPLLAMLKGVGTGVGRCLVLGGAGGAVPLYILQNYDKAAVDTVEINAESIRICEQYFLADFSGEGGRSRMIHDDAKNAVQTLEAPYQFIFCDLFVGGQPAEVVYDARFMREISRLSGENGLLVINGSGFSLQGARVSLKILRESFAYAWVMLISDGFVLMACNRAMPALDNLLRNGGVIPLYPSMMELEDAPTQAKQ